MIVTGELWGHLSVIWCVAMLLWNLFRNNTVPALIYGVCLFAAALIALNVGGVLNADTWHMLGIGVFGISLLINMLQKKVIGICTYSALLAISALLGW